MPSVCHLSINFGFTIPKANLSRGGGRVAVRTGEANMDVTLEAEAFKIILYKKILALARGYVILCSLKFVVGLKKI
jgi:hypothetical protein